MSNTPIGTPPADHTSLPGRPSDGALVRRFRAGDEDAATALYRRYADRLRALARTHCTAPFAGRFDADDIVQSAFRAFFAGVRHQTYDAPPDGEVWGLLMVLTLNVIRNLVDHHQAAKRTVHRTARPADLDLRAAAESDETAAALLRLTVDEHVAGLPEPDRRVVRLRIEGYEVKEIAARTGRSRRTVERVLQAFRARIARAD